MISYSSCSCDKVNFLGNNSEVTSWLISLLKNWIASLTIKPKDSIPSAADKFKGPELFPIKN